MSEILLLIGLGLNLIWLLLEIVFLVWMSKTLYKCSTLSEVELYQADELVKGMLNENGLTQVKLATNISSEANEKYSDETYIYTSAAGRSSRSLSVLAVTLHEAGHAIQHHKLDRVYYLSLYLTKMLRGTSLLAIPGILIAVILKWEILLLICVWVFAFSGLSLFIMYIADKRASDYALGYMEKLQILDSAKWQGFKEILNVTNWSYIQYVFEPFILVGVLGYTAIRNIFERK